MTRKLSLFYNASRQFLVYFSAYWHEINTEVGKTLMHTIHEMFGTGTDLSFFQMTCRAVTVFFTTLVFLRISGRRSFGMRTPLDNIITILLGAIISRGVVGASPFLPVIGCSLVIVLLHRGMSWLNVHSKRLSNLTEGRQILLFDEQRLIRKNMDKALVCDKDIHQALREKGSTESLGEIRKMYMEQNGEISVIKPERR